MGLFISDNFEDLRELLLNQLKDLYDAEHRIVDALPKMAEKASSPELTKAFTSHLRESEGHIEILEQAFAALGEEPERETCEACQGLLKEGKEILEATGPGSVIDAGLIVAAQRVEHYEIAGYGGAKAFALQLGEAKVAQLLDKILEQEKAADVKLTKIAEQSINSRAAAGQGASV